MNSTSGAWTTRHLLAISVIAAVVAASACSSGSGDSSARSAGASATAGAPDTTRPGAPAARVGRKVPVLTAKIEDISPEDFVKAVENVTWTGHIVERECGTPLLCSDKPGKRSTIVRHEAAEGANELDLATLPENGVVVSRMQNLGKHKEKFYDLPSGKGEWYVILTRGTNGAAATLQLVNLDFDGRGRPELDLKPRKWDVGRCDPELHGEADAGFKECPPPNPSPAAPPFALPTSFNRGAWFTCSLGCCTTEGVRGGTARRRGRDSTATDSAASDSAPTQRQPR